MARPEEIAVSLEDIRWARYSPGRLLCLDMHPSAQIKGPFLDIDFRDAILYHTTEGTTEIQQLVIARELGL